MKYLLIPLLATLSLAEPPEARRTTRSGPRGGLSARGLVRPSATYMCAAPLRRERRTLHADVWMTRRSPGFLPPREP